MNEHLRKSVKAKLKDYWTAKDIFDQMRFIDNCFYIVNGIVTVIGCIERLTARLYTDAVFIVAFGIVTMFFIHLTSAIFGVSDNI